MNLVSHFNSLGYELPLGCNSTDFVMDVLAGFRAKKDEKSPMPVNELVHTITDIWKKKYDFKVETFPGFFPDDLPPNWDVTILKHLRTLKISFKRQLAVYERTYESTIGTSLSLAVTGFLIALLFGSIQLVGDSNNLPKTPGIGGPGTTWVVHSRTVLCCPLFH